MRKAFTIITVLLVSSLAFSSIRGKERAESRQSFLLKEETHWNAKMNYDGVYYDELLERLTDQDRVEFEEFSKVFYDVFKRWPCPSPVK